MRRAAVIKVITSLKLSKQGVLKPLTMIRSHFLTLAAPIKRAI